MFVQMITLRAPTGKRPKLRQLVQDNYLPGIQQQVGFLHGYLLEQIDDPDVAQLIEVWESQSALEHARKTQLLTGTTQSLAANLPGLRIQQQGYISKVTTRNVAV